MNNTIEKVDAWPLKQKRGILAALAGVGALSLVPQESRAQASDSICVGEVVEAAVLDDKCRGAIDLLMRIGHSEAKATALAKQMGLYTPGREKESAVLPHGTRATKDSDGSIRFTYNGRIIAEIDCNENVIPFGGDYLKPEEPLCRIPEESFSRVPITPAPAERQPEPVKEAIPPGMKIMTQWVKVGNDPRCEEFILAAILDFATPEEATSFLTRNRTIPKELGPVQCVFVLDGKGNMQATKVACDGEIKTKFQDYRMQMHGSPKGALSEARAAAYLDGTEDPTGKWNPRERDILTFMPPMTYVSPDGTFAAPWTTANRREYIYNAVAGWLKHAHITVNHWERVEGMPLPEIFSNEKAKVSERAQALQSAFAARGVTLALSDAEFLAGMLLETQGGDARLGLRDKLRAFKDKKTGKDLTHPLTTESGELATFRNALLISASQQTGVMEGLNAHSEGRVKINFEEKRGR